MNRAAVWILMGCALPALAGSAARSAAGDPPTLERTLPAWAPAVFRVLDSLDDVPDVARGEYVRGVGLEGVSGFAFRRGRDRTAIYRLRYREEGGRTGLLSGDFSRVARDPERTDVAMREPPGALEPVDLDAVAREGARRMDAYLALPEPRPRGEEHWPVKEIWFAPRITHYAIEVFLLAWVCYRQGRDEAAATLARIAEACHALRVGYGIYSPERMEWKFDHTLLYTLAENEIWRLVLDAAEPSVPRDVIVRRARAFEKSFPESKHLDTARRMEEVYARMAKEDAERAARPPKPFDAMTPDERATDLIFRLRDQKGYQWGQPGSCDIFNGMESRDPGVEPSPAHQLVAMADAAVPALIEAIGDDRPTRSLQYHRDFGYSGHRLLTVGECASRIINRIAGPTGSPGYHTLVSDLPSVEKKAAQAWWAARQAGETLPAGAFGRGSPLLREWIREHDEGK